MKITTTTVWAILIIMGITSTLFAQDKKTLVKGKIEPYSIGVPFDRTVNLIFPYSIKSVDRGNSGILVQKATGIENVLQLKAADADFVPTNLTVITGEGALYSFMLHYNQQQQQLNFKVAEMMEPLHQDILFGKGLSNEGDIQDYARRIAVKKKSMPGLTQSRFDMELNLYGIYIFKDVLYLHFKLENSSLINYDIDQFRFYIRDKRKVKRTASQEIEILPQYIDGNVSTVEGHSMNSIVVAMDKFTIPDKKYFSIELQEKDGGRHLSLKLGNKHLVQARGL